MSDAELVAAAHENYVGSFRKAVEHTRGEIREFGGVFAFTTRLPISLFNGCVVHQRAAASDLEEALRWVRGQGFPYRAWIDEMLPPGLAAVAAAAGLQRDEAPYPGMVMHPIPEPPLPAPDLTVVAVAERDRDEHVQVRIGSGWPRDVAERLLSSSFTADPDVRLFTVGLEGRPAGASLAIRTAGVYAVGTLEAARRRGVGTAATWAAVAAGRAWGCQTVVLQASEMGRPIYEAMGFRTVVRYTTFKPAPTG